MRKRLHPQLIGFSDSRVLPVVMRYPGPQTIAEHIVELLVQLERIGRVTGGA